MKVIYSANTAVLSSLTLLYSVNYYNTVHKHWYKRTFLYLFCWIKWCWPNIFLYLFSLLFLYNKNCTVWVLCIWRISVLVCKWGKHVNIADITELLNVQLIQPEILYISLLEHETRIAGLWYVISIRQFFHTYSDALNKPHCWLIMSLLL